MSAAEIPMQPIVTHDSTSVSVLPSTSMFTPQTSEELHNSLDDMEELLLAGDAAGDDGTRSGNDAGHDANAAITTADSDAMNNPNSVQGNDATTNEHVNNRSTPQYEDHQNHASHPQEIIRLQPQHQHQHQSHPIHPPPTSWNAVHMEVQENAKLPTFNLPVDRSNATSGMQIPAPRGRRNTGAAKMRGRQHSRHYSLSSNDTGSSASLNHIAVASSANNATGDLNECPSSPLPKLQPPSTCDYAHTSLLLSDNHDHSNNNCHIIMPPMEAATSQAIDEILRLNENDLNLSELFLDGDDRSSAALAYSCYAGCIPKFEMPVLGEGSSIGDGNNFSMDVSETIDAKVGGSTMSNTNGNGVNNNNNNYLASKRPAVVPQPKSTSWLPYKRTKPLPIPMPALKLPPPVKEAGGSDGTNNSDINNNGSNGQSAISNQSMAEMIATATAEAIAATNSPTLASAATVAALSVQPSTISSAGASATSHPTPQTSTLDNAVPSPSMPPPNNIQPAPGNSSQQTSPLLPQNNVNLVRSPAVSNPAAPSTINVPSKSLYNGNPPPQSSSPYMAPPPQGHPAIGPPAGAPPIVPHHLNLSSAPPPAPNMIGVQKPFIHSQPPPPPGAARVNPPYRNIHPYTAQLQSQQQLNQKRSPPLHAAAHANPKASIVYATAQRSKFGFGGNHTVPSTPAPPPNMKGYLPLAIVRNPTDKKVSIKPVLYSRPPTGMVPPPMSRPIMPYKMLPSPPPITSSLGDSPPKDVGSAVAYERKKQRAKDARVRLNEAIEELAVAIDLAGSQSKERYDHLTDSLSSDDILNPCAENRQIHVLAKMMDETMKEAADAKKWDRPSFVGLSATLIHSLNAQCEGLMREMFELKRENEQLKEGRYCSASSDTMAGQQVASSTTLNSQSNSSESGQGGFSGSNDVEQNESPQNENDKSNHDRASKKQKVEPNQNESDIANNRTSQSHLIISDKIMAEEQRCLVIRSVMIETPFFLKQIATFLDPASMCRCLCVSKHWISQNVFQCQETWLNLCVKRFGMSSVRKWDYDEDEEDDESTSVSSPTMDLYCRMVEKNVKPYCSMEGSIFLGGSSLDGLVSGWVSLVERSNGETSRSVMLSQIHEGQTRQYYSSIPIIELRILLQNTGYSKGVALIPDQQFSVDASTRRKGEKMLEVSGDDRFKRRVLHVEKRGSQHEHNIQRKSFGREMCFLNLFESAVLSVHIHARACSTAAKFCHRAKKIQILVSIDGTTRPLVIPFQAMNGQR